MNFPPDWSIFGPKMRALRERERKFVWAYLLNSMTDGRENGAQAARDAGFPDSSDACKVRSHELLHRDDVIDAMQEVAGRELRGLAIPAVAALGKLLAKPEHGDHRKAIEMVLERVAPVRTQVDVNHSGEVTLNRTDSALEDLARYIELEVPRAKLKQIFGYSGLERYERMLAERDGKRPKIIEHRGEELNG
jgi:phage terminase small subunit